MPRCTPQLTKRQRKLLSAQSRLRARVGALLAHETAAKVHLHSNDNGPKMSEVLRAWAAPLLEPIEGGDLKLYRSALSFAALVWNAAAASENPASDVADEVIESVCTRGSEVASDTRDIIMYLVESKRREFADDERVILGTEVVDVGGQRRIHVASTALADRTS